MWALPCNILFFIYCHYPSHHRSQLLPLISTLAPCLSSLPRYSFYRFVTYSSETNAPFHTPLGWYEYLISCGLALGGSISWDRWESDWNNWCRQWKRALTKHPLFFKKRRNIQWKLFAALTYIPHTDSWCLGNTVKELVWTGSGGGGEWGLQLVSGGVVIIVHFTGYSPTYRQINNFKNTHMNICVPFHIHTLISLQQS